MARAAPKAPDQLAEDERSLVERARTGDATAFRELVERHKHRAYGLALRVLRSPEEAEEVTQDSFVKAWVALPGFRGESRFSTWIHTIVVRRALDRAAVLKHRTRREAPLEADDATAQATPGPSGERARLTLRMERVLEVLSPAQRAAVTLYYYQEHSVEDVANMLSLPTGTVKTHLSRARAALREAWLRDEAERGA